ncbi:hypothetical protein PR048_000964 [Dryococelus australis]|uniref:Uncharacterized protein n=1 Tax=Dryococelus australis TaxID=614101 RepID=A0ABQ9IIG6_9NEOP|nr:hypothetical protein PR048_000964 [Dryococelus australis]
MFSLRMMHSPCKNIMKPYAGCHDKNSPPRIYNYDIHVHKICNYDMSLPAQLSSKMCYLKRQKPSGMSSWSTSCQMKAEYLGRTGTLKGTRV